VESFVRPGWVPRDSEAIVVGAATPGKRHQRIEGSNFGRRVDCYAWGGGVATTGRGPDVVVGNFNGTSAAAAIVAGAAVVVQGIAKAYRGEPLKPETLRTLFRDPSLGTPSAHPDTDLIGVMPDLKKIIPRIFQP
jgi:hypothetical protein